MIGQGQARKAGTMRGGRYLVVLAGVGVLAAGCGTKVPGASHGLLPPGKSWIAIEAAPSGGLGTSLFGPFGGTDPRDLLSSLTAISSSVAKLGSAAIRGVQVTHFRVSVDPAKAAS